MGTETINRTVSDLNLATTEVFATIKSEEDLINNYLDRLNEIRSSLQSLLPYLESGYEKIVTAINATIEKKDLIILQEQCGALLTNLNKLIKTMEGSKGVYASLIPIYKTNSSDLREIVLDIKKRLSSNDQINTLLEELSNY